MLDAPAIFHDRYITSHTDDISSAAAVANPIGASNQRISGQIHASAFSASMWEWGEVLGFFVRIPNIWLHAWVVNICHPID